MVTSIAAVPQEVSNGYLPFLREGGGGIDRKTIFFEEKVEPPLRHGFVFGSTVARVVERHLEDAGDGGGGDLPGRHGGVGERRRFTEARGGAGLQLLLHVQEVLLGAAPFLVGDEPVDGLLEGGNAVVEVGNGGVRRDGHGGRGRGFCVMDRVRVRVRVRVCGHVCCRRFHGKEREVSFLFTMLSASSYLYIYVFQN